MSDSGVDYWIPHTVIDVGFIDATASLTVMCNYTRFDIDVDAKDLKDGSDETDIHNEFIDMSNDPGEHIDAFEDWAIAPCLTAMTELAPPPEKDQVFTLAQYFQAPTFNLILKVLNGRLIAERSPSDTASNSPLPSRMTLDDARLNLTTSSISNVPCYPATALDIIPKLASDGLDDCMMPSQVQFQGSERGQRLAFKAAQDSTSLLRELNVYCSLMDADREVSPNVAKLEGIVTLGSEILGILLTFIEKQGLLTRCVAKASMEDRRKWFEQITRTVSDLHALDLLWGDVKSDNVLVGVDGNAYVIDFGGGFSPDWVDRELADSKAGDLQGLERIRKFLDC